MKLDRNQNGRGKYAVVKLRQLDAHTANSLDALSAGGFVQFSKPGDADEFFVIKLKDQYAAAALRAYAEAARPDDPEYAADVMALADRAAAHPQRRKPD